MSQEEEKEEKTLWDTMGEHKAQSQESGDISGHREDTSKINTNDVFMFSLEAHSAPIHSKSDKPPILPPNLHST